MADILYYRLKIVDRATDRLDGTYAYSAICSVSLKTAESNASGDRLYPNPSGKGGAILETADSPKSPVIRVFDGLGRETPVRITGRSGKFYLETAGLLAGIYYVQVQTGKEQRAMQLVVIE